MSLELTISNNYKVAIKKTYEGNEGVEFSFITTYGVDNEHSSGIITGLSLENAYDLALDLMVLLRGKILEEKANQS